MCKILIKSYIITSLTTLPKSKYQFKRSKAWSKIVLQVLGRETFSNSINIYGCSFKSFYSFFIIHFLIQLHLPLQKTFLFYLRCEQSLQFLIYFTVPTASSSFLSVPVATYFFFQLHFPLHLSLRLNLFLEQYHQFLLQLLSSFTFFFKSFFSREQFVLYFNKSLEFNLIHEQFLQLKF